MYNKISFYEGMETFKDLDNKAKFISPMNTEHKPIILCLTNFIKLALIKQLNQ